MITRRVIAIVTLIAALFAGATAPASAETAPTASSPTDLDYHYRYDLRVETIYSPEELTWTIASRLNAYFPFFTDCSTLPPVGNKCELYSIPGLPAMGTSNPVRVIERTETSWTFVSLPGHVEGADRLITFSFHRGRYGFELDVYAWGPWTLSAALTVSSGTARNAWQIFADKISRQL